MWNFQNLLKNYIEELKKNPKVFCNLFIWKQGKFAEKLKFDVLKRWLDFKYFYEVAP